MNDSGDNLDPDRVWAALMTNEKPGGHGERHLYAPEAPLTASAPTTAATTAVAERVDGGKGQHEAE